MYDDIKKQLLTYSICGKNFEFLGAESTSEKEIVNSVYIKEYFRINDSTSFSLGCNGDFDKYLFGIFSGNKSIHSCINPDFSAYLSGDDKLIDILFGPSFFKINSHRNRAVWGSYKGGLFQIFDLSALPKSISMEKSSLFCAPYEGNLQERKIRYGFEDIFVTDNYIYALYNGKTNDENEGFAKEILVFDWLGVCRFKLESDVYLRSLCVDEQSKELFAAAYNSEKGFYLVKTRLPF